MLSNFRQLLLLTSYFATAAIAAPTDAPIPPEFKLVAQDDSGNPKGQPNLVAGASWTIPAETQAAFKLTDPRDGTVNHGPVIAYRYGGLRQAARYFVRIREMNDGPERPQTVFADEVELHGAHNVPTGKLQVFTYELPPATYQDAFVRIEIRKAGEANAIVAAVELWSDQETLIGPVGRYMRFRVDALSEKAPQWQFTGTLRIHSAPWTLPLKALGKPVTAAGFTEWIDLAKQPGKANGPITLSVPPGGRGATQFSLLPDEVGVVRELDWNEPDGTLFILDGGLNDVRTFREQERRYYLNALENAGTLRPLARPPLLFANAWGWAPTNANEYMAKSFRLMGMNSVASSSDTKLYASLYGWGTADGMYWPPTFMPYDEKASADKYESYFKEYFTNGKGKATLPEATSFQMCDEPGELAIKPADAHAGFVAWLAAQGLAPEFFGKATWDEINVSLDKNQPRLFYWSRKYQGMLTPKMFGLAAQALVKNSPNPNIRPFVALSGHSFNMGSRLPLDMFQLAQYPDVVPGISDWMSTGSWWWDSHQSVAWSVAPYNAGARRYGADFGKPPITTPMMHCVWPSLLRPLTQLANNCKLISYYNYGPDYMVTEGMWSESDWSRLSVGRVNNMSAQVDDILGPGQMRPSRVAQLYSMSNEYWSPGSTFADHRSTFLSLSHDYYQPDLVTEDQIANGALKHYDALYVLDGWVSTAAQDAIEKWTKEGGLLWACGGSLSFNEYNEKSDLLAKIAGLRREMNRPTTPVAGETAPVRPKSIQPAEGQPAFEQHGIPPQGIPWQTEWPGARVRAVYDTGAPGWQEGSVGKGKLVYLGFRPGIAYSWRGAKARERKLWPVDGRPYLTGPLLEGGIERELELSKPLVMTSAISTEAGTVVILYNLTHQTLDNTVLRLKEPKAPVSMQLFDDSMKLVDVPFTYENGRAVATLPYISEGGQMVLIRRKPAPADTRLAQMRATAEKSLASTEWQALSAGAWFAGFFPDWKLAPKLVPLLTHEHWAVRRSAAEALGRLGHAAAGPALLAAVGKEQDCNALADEVAALLALKHPEAAKLVAKLKADKNPFLRREGERLAAVK